MMKLLSLLLFTICYGSFGQQSAASTCYYNVSAQDSATGKRVIALSRASNSTVIFNDVHKCACVVSSIELVHLRGKRTLSSETIEGNKLRSADLISLFPNFQPSDRTLLEIKRAEDSNKQECKKLKHHGPGFHIEP